VVERKAVSQNSSGLEGSDRLRAEPRQALADHLSHPLRQAPVSQSDPRIGQILISMKAMTLVQFWEIIHAQGLFKCGGCGHTLSTPRIQGNALFCEKCGQASLTVDE